MNNKGKHNALLAVSILLNIVLTILLMLLVADRNGAAIFGEKDKEKEEYSVVVTTQVPSEMTQGTDEEVTDASETTQDAQEITETSQTQQTTEKTTKKTNTVKTTAAKTTKPAATTTKDTATTAKPTTAKTTASIGDNDGGWVDGWY